MISDYLGQGKQNARTSSELAQLTGLPERRVTKQIERERRMGTPICASSDSAYRRYYLASTPDELEQHTRAFNRHIRTITEGLDARIVICGRFTPIRFDEEAVHRCPQESLKATR